MSFAADLNACAVIVQKGDPDRFLAVMAAPVAARRVLFPLYALNVEVARAPWVTAEPMIAEMRLQWWRDALEEIATGAPVRRHEVVTPLAEILPAGAAHRLCTLVETRRRDIWREPFTDALSLWSYLEGSAGCLLSVAAEALSDQPSAGDAAGMAGAAAGLAGWLQAVPELTARGRDPLHGFDEAAIEALAGDGLDRLRAARAMRRDIPFKARPALLACWQARALLGLAARDPGRVRAGALRLSEAGKRARLIVCSATGRW